MPHEQEYGSVLTWTGNTGSGTTRSTEYERSHTVEIGGKPTLSLSAAAAFRGDPALHDPEDLFVASIASCHMLSYLAVCARNDVNVLAYSDRPTGIMVAGPEGGSFTMVTLHPTVRISRESDPELAERLHDVAHEQCYIAASCKVPIAHVATIVMQPEDS